MKSVLKKLKLMNKDVTDAASESFGPEIYAIRAEVGRQNENIELIASENFTSISVLETMDWS